MRKNWIFQGLDIGRLLRYLLNIPDRLLDHFLDVEQTRRVYLPRFISIILIITLVSFGIIVLIKGNYTLGALDFVLASILIGNILHARRYKHYTFNIYLAISLTAMFFVYMFLTGGMSGSGFVWYYTFPLVASFLLGSKKGAIATALILLPVIGLFLVKNPPIFLVNYSFDFKLRFISSFLVVFALSYLFEYSREKNREDLQKSHDDLEKRVEERTSALQEAARSFQREIGERRMIEEALRESEEAAQRLAQENATVAEIGRIISSTLNIEEVYERFAEEVRKVIPFDRIVITMIDHEKGTFRNEYNLGEDVPGRGIGMVIPLAGSLVEEVMRKRSGQLIHTEDRDELAGWLPGLLPLFDAGFRSFMSAPLISKDQVIGTLHIFSVRSKAYKEADKNLAESIGNQIAGAIANARLFAELRRAEDALREGEHFVSSVITGIQDGISILDKDMNIIRVNQTMERWYSYSVPLVGKRCYEAYHGRKERCEVCPTYQTISKGESAHEVVPKRGPSGDIVGWFDLYSFPLIDSSTGKMTGVIEYVRDITERKHAEETLQKSEERFKELYNDAPVGYHEYDTNGRITSVNRTELEMLGYTPEEVLGQPVWKFIGEEETSRYTVLAKLAGTTPPGHSFERTYRRKDGTKFPAIIEDRPLRDNEGRIIGIRSTIQDITYRKRAEEILKEYQKVIEGTQDMIAVVDQNSNYLLANNAFLKYRGVDREKVIGRSISEVLGKDVFEKVIKKNLDTCFQGKVVQHEMKYTYPVLGERDLLVSYFPIEGLHGVNRVASVIRDITERKRAEEKLRESEERFRELAENVREVFYIYGQDIQQLSYISPAYEEIWGRTCQSLYEEPRSFWDTIHPEDKNRVAKSLKKKSQREVEEVYRIVRPDGSIRWIKERSFPIYDDSGKAYRIVGIAADITDMKFGEEKLKYISLHDSLTGLYNRIYFEEEMSRMERARYDTVGIVSCDVDGLKIVNDTLGHDHGDKLLVAAARVIKESFREGDLVARIGGDEFSVLLPNATEPDVENACQRIQETVTSYNATNPELPLSISIGFAVKKGAHRNLKDLFKEADNNMYRKKLYRTNSVRSTIVKTLINTLEVRDLTTKKHAIRLEKLLVSLAAFIRLPESTTSDLSLLARFHDIGKVGISDSILFKKGPLTPEEWREMKRHCEIGYRMALSVSDLVPIADWILKHHEWWNGDGYPLGIKGEEIPLECRLLAIAEAYEALTSVRPYRNAFPHGQAVAELLNHSGTQFDPKLLKKFLQMLETHLFELESNASSAV